jgi:hypothetical protein
MNNKLSFPPELLDEEGRIADSFRKRAYRIFTIRSGSVTEGAEVDRLALKGAGIQIPVLAIGEEGRGRERGIIPVQLNQDAQERWVQNEGTLIHSASLGATKAGRIKLFQAPTATDDEYAIGVLRTPIGYRGSNRHTGDRNGEKSKNTFGEEIPCFHDFPGIVLERGVIAQGGAGRMGSGSQLISLLEKNRVFRTAYAGRLYGSPSSHYYKYDGARILAATWDERLAGEVF